MAPTGSSKSGSQNLRLLTTKVVAYRRKNRGPKSKGIIDVKKKPGGETQKENKEGRQSPGHISLCLGELAMIYI